MFHEGFKTQIYLLLLLPLTTKKGTIFQQFIMWCGSVVKNPASNAENTGSIPGLGRLPGEGNGNPLQYSCLRNPMDRGAWQARVHGVAEEWDRT